jgi:hypothetical protein
MTKAAGDPLFSVYSRQFSEMDVFCQMKQPLHPGVVVPFYETFFFTKRSKSE